MINKRKLPLNRRKQQEQKHFNTTCEVHRVEIWRKPSVLMVTVVWNRRQWGYFLFSRVIGRQLRDARYTKHKVQSHCTHSTVLTLVEITNKWHFDSIRPLEESFYRADLFINATNTWLEIICCIQKLKFTSRQKNVWLKDYKDHM